MFFVDRANLEKRLRRLRLELQEQEVSEELRGWSWEAPPVAPPLQGPLLGVGEVAARYCESMRDLYLRRVEGVPPPPSTKLLDGLALHRVAETAVTEVKRYIYSRGLVAGSELVEDLLLAGRKLVEDLCTRARVELGLEADKAPTTYRKALKLYRFLILQAGAQIDRFLSKFPHTEVDSLVSLALPPIVERKVDGSLLGLAQELSVDLYTPIPAVADLKTGGVRAFHRYAPTGYALALESQEEVEVNYGFIVYVRLSENHPTPSFRLSEFLIGDEVRREFLDLRDMALEVLEAGRDPGKPSSCPTYCPYYHHCNPAK